MNQTDTKRGSKRLPYLFTAAVLAMFVMAGLAGLAMAAPAQVPSIQEADQSTDGPVDVGPLVGDQSVFVQESQCQLQLTHEPGSGLTNYWPAIGAAEHTDSTHSGGVPCATFTGSFTGTNQVFFHVSETNFGDVQFIVFDGPNGAYLMGGGLGVPGSMGQFVSKFNPSSGKEIWRTYLQNANVNGQWIAFGSMGIIKDGTIIAAAGPYVWKLDRDSGDILAYNELPVLGSPAQGANYDGFHVAPDEQGTILMKTQNVAAGCTEQGNAAMMTCKPQPPTTVIAADPKTLEAIDAIQLDEQVTARPIVTEYNDTIYMYMDGETILYRIIWDPDAQKLTVDESWAPEYLLDGQSSGSAPAVLGDWIVSNTNTNPSQVPMSVVAVHQDDATRLTRINPWGDTLPDGVVSMTWGSFGADPENNMIFAQDWFAGGVHGIRIDQDTGEMEVVWSRDDWRNSDYFSMIGPADQRVLLSQSIGDDFSYDNAFTYGYSENVVWVNAMTGETIAQSADTPSTAVGSLPNIGYGGRLYMMGNAGDVFIYQVAPVSDDAAADPESTAAATADTGEDADIPEGWTSPQEMDSAMGPTFTLYPDSLTDARDFIYCELVFNYGDAGSDIYSTSPVAPCDLDWWDSLDLDALAAELSADSVVKNGPEWWAMDTVQEMTSEPTTVGGIDMVYGAVLPPGTMSTPTYEVFNTAKYQYLVYQAGKPTYQLVDPDGNAYIVQGYKVDQDQLATLGDQFQELPEGWVYQVVTPDEDLVLNLTPAAPIPSVQDEFDQIYIRIPE